MPARTGVPSEIPILAPPGAAVAQPPGRAQHRGPGRASCLLHAHSPALTARENRIFQAQWLPPTHGQISSPGFFTEMKISAWPCPGCAHKSRPEGFLMTFDYRRRAGDCQSRAENPRLCLNGHGSYFCDISLRTIYSDEKQDGTRANNSEERV